MVDEQKELDSEHPRGRVRYLGASTLAAPSEKKSPRAVRSRLVRTRLTPALAVTKPGAPAGVFRFAQDFRAGNKFTLTDRHGLPRPIDVAYELSGSQAQPQAEAAYITRLT